MNRIVWMSGLLLLCLARVSAQPVLEPEAFAAALKRIAAYTLAEGENPYRADLEAIRAAVLRVDPVSPERAEIARLLAATLAGEATLDGRWFVAKQLYLAATPAEIPVLAPLLEKKDTSDMARYALEALSDKGVTEALIAALPKADAASKVGIVNTLGARRDWQAFDALAAAAKGGPEEVLAAALRAMAAVNPEKANEYLVAAARTLKGDLQRVAYDARLDCAARIREAGKLEEAKRIYSALISAPTDAVWRSAFVAVCALDNEEGVQLIYDALTSAEEADYPAAAQAVRGLTSTEGIGKLAKQFPTLRLRGRVLLMYAIADLGNPVALPSVIEAARSRHPEVCIASITALGAMGGADVIFPIAETGAKSTPAVAQAAQEQLARLQGENIDEALIRELGRGDEKAKLILIAAIEERGLTRAIPVLLKLASEGTPSVRLAALKSLAVLGDAAAALDILNLMPTFTDMSLLNAARLSAVAIAERTGTAPQATAAALRLLEGATAKPILHQELLRTVGYLGHDDGLPVLREMLAGEAEGMRLQAIEALSNWPSVSALPELLESAKSGASEKERTLVLRGAIRLIGLPGDRAAGETLDLYAQTLALALGDEERRMILAGLAAVDDAGALQLVSPFLDHAALAPDAEAATAAIRKLLFKTTASENPDEAGLAVDGESETRWGSRKPQEPGIWLAVDMGAPIEVKRIVLDAGSAASDYPREYEVYLSEKEGEWGAPAAHGTGERTPTVVEIAPARAQFVKIVLTGKSGGEWWSVAELSVFGR